MNKSCKVLLILSLLAFVPGFTSGDEPQNRPEQAWQVTAEGSAAVEEMELATDVESDLYGLPQTCNVSLSTELNFSRCDDCMGGCSFTCQSNSDCFSKCPFIGGSCHQGRCLCAC